MLCMKTIASRQLAANPGKIWKTLEEEGSLVVTKDGVPRCIMLPTSDASLIEDLQDLVYARARRAVSAIRSEANRQGTSSLGKADVEAEIKAVRKSRKRRNKAQ